MKLTHAPDFGRYSPLIADTINDIVDEVNRRGERQDKLEEIIFCLWAMVSGKILKVMPGEMAGVDAHETLIDRIDSLIKDLQGKEGLDKIIKFVQGSLDKDPEFLGQRSYILSLAMERVQALEELSARLWLKAAEELVTGYPPDERIKALGNKVGIEELNRWIQEGSEGAVS